MKAESCLPGKAPPVLRQQTKRERTGRVAVPVDDNQLTAQLQIQISGDVSRDIAAAVIFDEYCASGVLRIAGNAREHQRNNQYPLCATHISKRRGATGPGPAIAGQAGRLK